MGEALFAIGLANTVFFSTDPNQSRWRVTGYLLLTFAPFLVAGPFIGPVLDRAKGGRKWVIFAAAIARAVLCLLLLRNLDDIYFYPEAFLMLVFSKVNLISKAALVPTTVNNDEELVEANSKLASLGAMSAVAGALVAGIAVVVVRIPFLKLDAGHAQTVAILGFGAVAFLAAAVQAWNLPKTQVAEQEPGEAERIELHSSGIFLAASATGLCRGIMGFLTFLLAFWVKNDEHPLVWIGVLVAAAQVGYFAGSFAAPVARRSVTEERMIQGSLAAMSLAAMATYFLLGLGDGLGGAAILAFTVGLTSNVLKQAFDSLVQRDAPDANRGRSFARFETRFQMWWAIGALLPVAMNIALWVGVLIIAAVSGFALVSYVLGLYELTEVVAGRRQPRQPKQKPWSPEALRARRKGAGTPEALTDIAPPSFEQPALAGKQPGVPLGPATAAATDPTAVDPTTDALFGQPDAPLPDVLYESPQGGLFDPAAPPPPKGPGYHRRQPGPASGASAGATGATEWAAVVPPEPSRFAPVHRVDSHDHGELDIVGLPDGTYAYRGTLGSEPEETPDQWLHAEPNWREPGSRPHRRDPGDRTTGELPAVDPPPDP